MSRRQQDLNGAGVGPRERRQQGPRLAAGRAERLGSLLHRLGTADAAGLSRQHAGCTAVQQLGGTEPVGYHEGLGGRGTLVNVHAYTDIYVRVYTYVYANVDAHVYTCACTHAYTRTYAYLCAYLFAHLCTSLYA